jgi:hypothetical protein
LKKLLHGEAYFPADDILKSPEWHTESTAVKKKYFAGSRLGCEGFEKGNPRFGFGGFEL